jgi:CRP/FNR family cyclic AMP-dependent transcriptional regulator
MPTPLTQAVEARPPRILPMPLRRNAKVAFIKNVPLFASCTQDELAAIAAEADELALPSGRNLTTQGETGREFIVIADGTADVRKNGRIVARLGPGDFVGEIALITGGPRVATVTTTSQATVLVLTDRAFDRMIKKAPSVQTKVMKALAERLHADAL